MKGLKGLLDEFRKSKEANIILFSAGISLAGNICLSVSNMLSAGYTGGKTGLMLAGLFFSLLIIVLGYFFSIGMIYFILSLMGRKIEPAEFIALFLSSDFLFVITLPIAIILLLFPLISPAVSGMIFIIVIIMSIALKIRAITLCSSVGNFGSTALFFTPALYVFFALLIFVIYGIIKILKLLAY
jgi:hypothetical protein